MPEPLGLQDVGDRQCDGLICTEVRRSKVPALALVGIRLPAQGVDNVRCLPGTPKKRGALHQSDRLELRVRSDGRRDERTAGSGFVVGSVGRPVSGLRGRVAVRQLTTTFCRSSMVARTTGSDKSRRSSVIKQPVSSRPLPDFHGIGCRSWNRSGELVERSDRAEQGRQPVFPALLASSGKNLRWFCSACSPDTMVRQSSPKLVHSCRVFERRCSEREPIGSQAYCMI